MRITQLAGWYSPVSGGIRTVVHRLAAGYRERGHEPVLVVPGPRAAVLPDRIEVPGTTIPWSGGYRWVWRRPALVEVLARSAPDVVELHDKAWLPTVRPWADAHGVPVVLVSHERLDRTARLLFPWLPAPLTAAGAERVRCMVQRSADAVVVCSGFAAAEYPAAVRVPLGVDLLTFAPAAAAAGRRSGPVRLLLASRLAREKRPDLALAAVAALRRRGVDAHLTVLGDGPCAARLQRAAVGLPVTFAGHTADRAALAAALGSADVVLAPGPAETFGLSALEALACGTPVVAAPGAAVAELVHGAASAGRAATALHGDAFAAAVLDLLADPAPTRRASARAVAERYPWSRTVERMLAVHAAALVHHAAVVREHASSSTR